MDKIEIIFLIIDIVEFFAIFFMAKVLSNAIKEYKKKTLLSVTFGVVLSAHPTLLVVLIILAVLFFLVICELAYKVHFYKTREVVKKVTSDNVPLEIYHYDGQVVDGVEYKEHSYDNDEVLLEDVPQEEKVTEEKEALEEPQEESTENL